MKHDDERIPGLAGFLRSKPAGIFDMGFEPSPSRGVPAKDFQNECRAEQSRESNLNFNVHCMQTYCKNM